MANLYGYLTGDRGARQTKASSSRIASRVQTWNGAVMVELDRYGNYAVTTGPGPNGGGSVREVASGTVGGSPRRRAAPRRTTRRSTGIAAILKPRRHRRHW